MKATTGDGFAVQHSWCWTLPPPLLLLKMSSPPRADSVAKHAPAVSSSSRRPGRWATDDRRRRPARARATACPTRPGPSSPRPLRAITCKLYLIIVGSGRAGSVVGQSVRRPGSMKGRTLRTGRRLTQARTAMTSWSTLTSRRFTHSQFDVAAEPASPSAIGITDLRTPSSSASSLRLLLLLLLRRRR